MENKLSPSLIQEFLKMRQRIGELEALRTENAKLHELFRDLSALLSSAGELACIMDASGSILYMNEPEEYSALKQEIYSGKSFLSIFDAQSASLALEAFRAAFSGNTVKCILRLKTGMTWECKSAPFMEETGRISGVMFTAKDITAEINSAEQLRYYIAILESIAKSKANEAARARQALKGAQDRFGYAKREKTDLEDFFSKVLNSADPVLLADECGMIVFANKMAGELMGLPPEKIVGMHQSELHPEEDAQFYTGNFVECFIKKEALVKDVVIRRAGGARLTVEITSRNIRLNGKEFIYGIFKPVECAKQVVKDDEKTMHPPNLMMWPVPLKRLGGFGNA